jgi:phosphohistidine phosphatase
MDLILWRHADAEDGAPDLARKLTAKGRSQAARVATWLYEHVPPGFGVVSSPAVRALQTAEALGVAFDTSPLLAPGAPVASILSAAGWPDRGGCVILVGHQPDFGRAAAFLVAGEDREWRIDKGGLWWIGGEKHPFVKAVISPGVISPDLL